jgi:hypothetical protein
MKYGRLLLLSFVCLASLSNAQQPAMSATAGLGPTNSFTFFVTFQDPMPEVNALNCTFSLATAVQPGQEDFRKSLTCTGAVNKTDETHYSSVVNIPVGVASGDYKLDNVVVSVGSAQRTYQGQNLPALSPVPINNPEHIKFSPIKKLDVKP